MFKADEYNKLMANCDWLGMADYLEANPTKDPTKQSIIRNQIRQLRKKSAIEDRLFGNDTNKRDLYRMYEGNISRSNKYGAQYLKEYDKIGESKKEQADQLMLSFNNIEDRDKFLNDVGVTIDNAGANGFEIHNGSKELEGWLFDKNIKTSTITFDKSNKNYTKIIQALQNYNSQHNRTNSSGGSKFGTLGAGVNMSQMVLKMFNPDEPRGIDIIGLKQGRVISKVNSLSDDTTWQRLRNMTSITKEGKKVYDDVLKQMYENSNVEQELTVSGFRGAKDSRIHDLWVNGKIDKQTYDEYRSRLYEQYDNLVASAELVNYENVFYSEGIKEGKTLREVDGETKGRLTEEIRTALAQNRLKYVTANRGGVVGTLFTISEKPKDENGESPDIGDAEGFRNEKTIFVPGFFRDKYEDELSNDTKNQAQREYTDCQRYGISYKSGRNFVISSIGNTGGFVSIKGGKKEWKDKEEILKMIDEDLVRENAIDAIRGQFVDENGNFTDKAKANQYAQAIAISEIEDLYSGQSEAYKKKKYMDLYADIKNKLGL